MRIVVLIEQIDAMLNFVENHPELLAMSTMAKTEEGRSMCKKYWTACAEILNSVSSDCTLKTADEWRLYYNDFKCKTLRRVKAQKSIQAGQPGQMLVLTNAQRRLYKLLGSLSGAVNRTDEQMGHTSDEMKNTSQQSLVQETNSQSHAQVRQESRVTVTIDDESGDDPLMGVKQEAHWITQDDSHSENSDVDDDSFFPPTRNESPPLLMAPPPEPAGPLNPDFALRKEEDYKLMERNIERAEELHKLKVAEKIWLLKTLRERHSTARLERERAQIERDRARLERDHAQLHLDKAQLELNRARRDDANYDT